jgi:hypothetical protein
MRFTLNSSPKGKSLYPEVSHSYVSQDFQTPLGRLKPYRIRHFSFKRMSLIHEVPDKLLHAWFLRLIRRGPVRQFVKLPYRTAKTFHPKIDTAMSAQNSPMAEGLSDCRA